MNSNTDVEKAQIDSMCNSIQNAINSAGAIRNTCWSSLFLFVVTFFALSFYFGMVFTDKLNNYFHFSDSSILVTFCFILIAVLGSTIYSQFLSFVIFFTGSFFRGHERQAFNLIKKTIIKELGFNFSNEILVSDKFLKQMIFALSFFNIEKIPKKRVYLGFNWLLFSLLHRLMVIPFNKDFKDFMMWDKIEVQYTLQFLMEMGNLQSTK